jgi:RNA ligase
VTHANTYLRELVNMDDLDAAVAAKHVKIQTHPAHPGWRILNYTDRCMWDRAWTPTTMTCRGLIIDDTGKVMARPWQKFFNHGEPGAAPIFLTEPVEVTDKLDGSLGIIYHAPDGWAVATRGSFASEQAEHATSVYRDQYADHWAPADGYTYLVEIIYPENRIVLDYGSTDDLVLLGAVHIATGATFGPNDPPCGAWPGPRTDIHDHPTLVHALGAKPRPNAEGLVVRSKDTGLMVKIKQEDYITLHRLLTGLTARRLWERTAVHAILAYHPSTPHRSIGQALRLDSAKVTGIADAGPDWLDDVRKTAPEEFTEWINDTIDEIAYQVTEIIREVTATASNLSTLPRKDGATALADHQYRGMVFAALDGKPIALQAWAAVRPAHEVPFRTVSEDVA